MLSFEEQGILITSRLLDDIHVHANNRYRNVIKATQFLSHPLLTILFVVIENMTVFGKTTVRILIIMYVQK